MSKVNQTRGSGISRDGARVLGAAEGILASICRYGPDDAFLDLVTTARRHNVAPLAMAAAVVAAALDSSTLDGDDETAVAIDTVWGRLLRHGPLHETGSAEVGLASGSPVRFSGALGSGP